RGDWNAVKAAWQRMPEAQRDDSRWTYLAARASEKLGDAAGAKALFAQAAKRPDFHGFLAADKLDASYALCPWTPAVAPAAKAAIAGDANIIRAVQLAALDRKA